MNKQRKEELVLHLYRRAAFGWPASGQRIPATISGAVKKLIEDSSSYEPLELTPPAEMDTAILADSLEAKQFRLKDERQRISKLNISWMQRMVSGKGALRERMALFWHNHFACRSASPLMVQRYCNVVRKNALGSFADMLLEVSKEPAMLGFLNNQQNRKGRPNENFAREVMELFTLGHGHYSEQDIKEAARAFTGWGYTRHFDFEFREKQHDFGPKTVLGVSGDFRGEDVIAILLRQKQTARHLVGKIYSYFVGGKPDPSLLENLTDRFYESGYQITPLLKRIFKEDAFYSATVRGALVKSPVELLAGIQSTLEADFIDPQSLLYIQKVLGQVLFYPPNVAGWPGGLSWIDSSSLLFRMQIPELMAGTIVSKVNPKNDGDVNTEALNKKAKSEKARVDWKAWADRFEKYPLDELPAVLVRRLLAIAPQPSVMDHLTKVTSSLPDRIQQIRSLTLSLMSLPEYQLV